MKRIITQSLALLSCLAFMAVPAMAAKPADVISKSNGFPSGPHFNMIIHGKDTSVFSCDSTSVGGNSIFVPEYTTDDLNGAVPGEVSIQYIQNKKASLIDLLVLDPCAIDDGLAKVQLPDKVMLDDGSTQPTDGFWVYAKITGKPNNGKYCDPPTPDCPSKIILYPNNIVAACNDPGNTDFGTYTSCPEDPELALGVIWNNTYIPDPATGDFVRFDPGTTTGQGKSMGKDITRLFVYVGWVVAEGVDVTGDGSITNDDIPAEALQIITDAGMYPSTYDSDGSGTINTVEEWLLFQQDMGMAWYFSEEENTWMHEIADLVVTEQGLTNMGTKTLEVRFYPRSTTVFH
jgi:hypothetical protein